jgi:hypothetical protein
MILVFMGSAINRDNNVLIVVGLERLESAVSMNFKTDLFQAEPLDDPGGSDGWGVEFAQWLQPKLEALGYKVHALSDGSCGWDMVLQREPFVLEVSCSVGTGELFSNADALGVGKDEAVWTCFAHAATPFFKSLFNKINTDPAESKLSADLLAILTAEPRIVFVAEPELARSNWDSDDN